MPWSSTNTEGAWWWADWLWRSHVIISLANDPITWPTSSSLMCLWYYLQRQIRGASKLTRKSRLGNFYAHDNTCKRHTKGRVKGTSKFFSALSWSNSQALVLLEVGRGVFWHGMFPHSQQEASKILSSGIFSYMAHEKFEKFSETHMYDWKAPLQWKSQFKHYT